MPLRPLLCCVRRGRADSRWDTDTPPPPRFLRSVSVRGCSNILSGHGDLPSDKQKQCCVAYGQGHREVGVPPLPRLNNHTRASSSHGILRIFFWQKAMSTEACRLGLTENHPDHGLFRHLGKIGANHGLFRPSGFDLHSPFWSMAIEVSRIQHHTPHHHILNSSFTRSTLIHAADPEPPPRVDVPSPAASSRSVVASSVSYHLPNQTAKAPHQNILSLHSLPRSHTFLCRSRGPDKP